MKLHFFLLAFGIYIVSFMAIDASANNSKSNPLYDCKPTVEFNNSKTHPGAKNIIKTNDLRRITGSGYMADGKTITISGRVVDEHCQAISNAEVEIWQADFQGATGEKKDEHFAGSGRTSTNNVGWFTFNTIMPASTSQNTAPYINFKAHHPEHIEVRSLIFFPDHPKNAGDSRLLRMQKDGFESPISERNGKNDYYINISLSGVTPHREY